MKKINNHLISNTRVVEELEILESESYGDKNPFKDLLGKSANAKCIAKIDFKRLEQTTDELCHFMQENSKKVNLREMVKTFFF